MAATAMSLALAWTINCLSGSGVGELALLQKGASSFRMLFDSLASRQVVELATVSQEGASSLAIWLGVRPLLQKQG